MFKSPSVVVALLLISSVSQAAAPALPKVFTLDPQQLAQTKQNLAAKDVALAQLKREADKALKEKCPSVMDKAKTPPTGDKHDYMSLAPYFWPDPNKADGLPYINRDGEVNPESRVGNDHDPMGHMASSVESLALAYYFTGHEPYAQKAAEFLQVWFLDPATKMNPHLDYAQAVLGRNTGRGIGIIDSVSLINVVNSVGLLEGSPACTSELRRGLQAWFRDYLKWMLTSKNGLDEAKTTNNHVSWYCAQVAAYALFADDTKAARKAVEEGRSLIARQIENDGRQPLELKRTKSYSYTMFNLQALFALAEAGKRLDIDLYHYRTEDGRSLRAALDYVVPYYDGTKSWPGKQIKDVKQPDPGLASLMRRAARLFPDGEYEQLLAKTDSQLASHRFQLLWPKAK